MNVEISARVLYFKTDCNIQAEGEGQQWGSADGFLVSCAYLSSFVGFCDQRSYNCNGTKRRIGGVKRDVT